MISKRLDNKPSKTACKVLFISGFLFHFLGKKSIQEYIDNSGMEYISDRIRLKRLELKLNQRDLARKLKLTAPSISQWERGISAPKGNNLINLAKLFKTTPEWLLTGIEKQGYESSCVNIPLLENVAASGGGGAFNDDELHSGSTIPIPHYVVKNRQIENIKCIRIMGDSMEPTLYDGGVAAVDMSEVAIRDGKIYVFRLDGMLRVKRLISIVGGVVINSQNPAYEAEQLFFKDATDFQIVGRCIWGASML